MSAGTGILHSEKNDAWRLTGAREHQDPVAFRADVGRPRCGRRVTGLRAARDRRRAAARRARPRRLGHARAPRRGGDPIAQQYAALHAARLQPGGTVTLPVAPYVHLFVARGSVELEGGGPLSAGDAVRITGSDGQRVTATADAELLAWEMHARLAA
jgi:redox-sensitive bicupin YhaK (pirin superfamily)